ncbi:MAG: carboxylating nicotinate-nucleotide diphosphorylase [Candidatus Izimaplasma sp.]|nr:carboxylating nicotinate-nucleotide diphosphorylase [Candidatus Izimaplasma bacterium]
MDKDIQRIIKQALKEDIPSIDVSSEYLFTNELSQGDFIAKEDGIISGISICKAVFLEVDSTTEFAIIKNDGDKVRKGDIIATVKGSTKSILIAERVGLNFLQRMSGIASMTRKFVDQTKGYKTEILDTRKTTPLLRVLEKKAVVDGGGINHRMNLSDMVMLKDNHLKATKNIIDAVSKVRENVGELVKIEVEVENLSQLKDAINSDCDIIMLDNMSNQMMKEAVKINQQKKILEASGNMTIERIKSVCKTGVDYISVGAITHSYKSLDISLKF